MKLSHLHTFIAVAEELHFRRAAERLYTQPSAVSTAIQQLETEYGVSLFVRNSRNVELTPAGELLVDKARLAIASINELERSARSLASDEASRLRVATVDEGHAEIGVVANANYSERFPQADLAVDALNYDQLTAVFDDPGIDLVVTTGPAEWFDPSEVLSVPLFSESRMAVLPHDHRLAGEVRLHLEDLMDEPFLKVRGVPDIIHRFFFLADLRDLRRSPDVEVDATQMTNLLNHVSQGRGIFTVTNGNERFFPRPDIVYVPMPDLVPGLVAINRRISDGRPHVLAYIEECTKAVESSLDLIPKAARATPRLKKT